MKNYDPSDPRTWPASAKFFDRIDHQHAGLVWHIHCHMLGLRRRHPQRIKQAALMRDLRAKFPQHLRGTK